MGPPPPPPPPPPEPVLPYRRGPSESTPRRNNNPPSASPAKTRPCLDPSALQHAAARLRKTVDGQQIRSEQTGVSHGALAGENQQLSGQYRPSVPQSYPLGVLPPREQVYATPSRSVPPGPLSNVRDVRTDQINTSRYNTYTPPIVTIQSPTDSPSANYNSKSPIPNQYSNNSQYSVPSNYSSYSSTSPSSNTKNVTGTHTYIYESPYNPPQTQSYSYSSTKSNQTRTNNNYVSQYANVQSTNDHYQTSKQPRSTSPYISDARARIHDFATSTPAEDLYSTPNSRSPTHQNQQSQSSYSGYSTINKTINNQSIDRVASPIQKGNEFAKELRDQARSTLISLLPKGEANSSESGLTERQRYSNQFQKSNLRETNLPFDVNTIYKQSYRHDEVDQLIHQMSHNMNTGRGVRNVCVCCNLEVTNDMPGCTAMDKVYHVACFKCKRCGSTLAGSSFYNVDGDAICEKDYQDSLERCTKCNKPISDKLLRACGGTFHVACFTCTVCNFSLDGVPFTVDPENQVHCVPCYHQRYAPRCAVCTTPIVPKDGEKESVRVVAMDKSFHVECYRCEDCGMQLSSKVEGQGCYPIDTHLFCKACNSNRLRVMSSS